MPDLSRKRERDRLTARREPYWQRLDQGRYLGFRAGADTWVARLRDRAGKQHYNALPPGNYDDAKKAAEKWFQQIGAAPVRGATKGTVREALETYLAHLKEQGREATAKVALPKFRKLVWSDPLATIPMHRLAREDFRAWRERIRDGRQPRSVNRIVRDVKAGLNLAIREGYAGDKEAWNIEPLADEVEDAGETAVFLTAEQRKRLTDATSEAASRFFRALTMTGARPSELAAARVQDFDAGTLRLAHRKGRPPKLRVRSVVLSNDAVAFFKEQAKGKLPQAWLFLDPEGKQWERHAWAEAFRDASAAVNAKARGKHRIPPDASAYSFRHARISELLQVYEVDPLTVAEQTGTSLRMIERTYFKFIASALREKLSRVREG